MGEYFYNKVVSFIQKIHYVGSQVFREIAYSDILDSVFDFKWIHSKYFRDKIIYILP